MASHNNSEVLTLDHHAPATKISIEGTGRSSRAIIWGACSRYRINYRNLEWRDLYVFRVVGLVGSTNKYGIV